MTIKWDYENNIKLLTSINFTLQIATLKYFKDLHNDYFEALLYQFILYFYPVINNHSYSRGLKKILFL